MQNKDAVILPSPGEGVFEATLVRWIKPIGSKVARGEPLLEISTDKVDTEIVSPAEGYLVAVFAQPGQVIKVHHLIAQISESPSAEIIKVSQPEGLGAKTSSVESSNPNPRTTPRRETNSRGVSDHAAFTDETYSLPPRSFAGFARISPLVRKLAREYNVDLGEVVGTGLYGRITYEDFKEYLYSVYGINLEPNVPMSPSNHIPKRVVRWEQAEAPENRHSLPTDFIFKQQTQTIDGRETLDGVHVTRQAMSHIRLKTAEHMIRSVRISPHVTTTFEMDLNNVTLFKAQAKKPAGIPEDVKLTYTCFFIHAAIAALKEFPIVNASVDGDSILLKDKIQIGCAVATPQGLLVPVLKQLENANLWDIASQLLDLSTRARTKKLKPIEVTGATFTITNPGMYGSLHSQPIINQPQVAIMSIGSITRRPVVMADDSLEIHPICQVGLTFDHRVLDGENGALFLQHIKNSLLNFV